MLLLEQKNGKLEYDETVPCVKGTFSGFMSSEDFRQFLNKGLEYCIKYKKEGKPFLWLADTRLHSVQSKADTNWVATDWTPIALQNGIQYVAFVLPENVFGELSVRNYVNEAKKTNADEMNIQMFNQEKTAVEWFKHVAFDKN